MLLSELVASDHVAAVITDPTQPDNPIVDCSDTFLVLTGYEREEVIGRNCRFLAGPGTDPVKQQMIRAAISEQRPVVVELLNYRKDGTPFLNSVMIAPIQDADNVLIGFVGSQLEIPGEEESFLSEGLRLAQSLIAACSPRQTQVLSRMAQGKRIKQIAFELNLSERTVKLHRAALLKSLNVSTNAEAIRIAVRGGL